MTVDELLAKVNDGWGWATLELSRAGDRQWTASFQCVDVYDGKKEIEQQFQKDAVASNAVKKLIHWIRGKRMCHRGTNGGAGGTIIDVPLDLEIPVVS